MLIQSKNFDFEALIVFLINEGMYQAILVIYRSSRKIFPGFVQIALDKAINFDQIFVQTKFSRNGNL